MKQKYKIQIFITIAIVSLIWGMLGGYLAYKNQDQQLLVLAGSLVGYFITLLVPVRMISKKAQKDLLTA